MKKDGEEELVVIGGEGVNLSGGADQIAPEPPFPEVRGTGAQGRPTQRLSTEAGSKVIFLALRVLIETGSKTKPGLAVLTADQRKRPERRRYRGIAVAELPRHHILALNKKPRLPENGPSKPN